VPQDVEGAQDLVRPPGRVRKVERALFDGPGADPVQGPGQRREVPRLPAGEQAGDVRVRLPVVRPPVVEVVLVIRHKPEPVPHAAPPRRALGEGFEDDGVGHVPLTDERGLPLHRPSRCPDEDGVRRLDDLALPQQPLDVRDGGFDRVPQPGQLGVDEVELSQGGFPVAPLPVLADDVLDPLQDPRHGLGVLPGDLLLPPSELVEDDPGHDQGQGVLRT
jgi:hypothetical protein